MFARSLSQIWTNFGLVSLDNTCDLYSTHLFKKTPILAHRAESVLVRHACALSVAQSRACRFLPINNLTQVQILQYKKCTLVQALKLCTGRTGHRGSRDIALLFHDHGTRRGEGSALRSGHSLSPRKTRYPLYRRLGGPQGRSGQVRKISRPPGFDPRTVQPVASRYTD